MTLPKAESKELELKEKIVSVKKFEKEYFKIAFSIDNVIFGFDNNELKVLLIKRGEQPFYDFWALPGDLVYPTEDLRDAPQRILNELTGIQPEFLEQCKTFGKMGRHPSGRVITIVYLSLINANKVKLRPSSFAETVAWKSIKSLEALAFDHDEILQHCLLTLKQSVQQRPVGFELLSEEFTLSDLQNLYEAILDKPLDKRNFRKKILSMNILVDTDKMQSGVAHRPARLYKFDQENYRRLKEEGFSFGI